MNRMLDSTKKIHDKHSAEIRKIRSILADHFNINKFYYGKLHDSGQYFGFDSNLDFMQDFETTELFHEYPFHCHPKYHQSGVQMINVAENLQSMHMEVTKNCMLKFGANLWIRLVNKMDNAVEEFGFHSSQFDCKQSLFLFNQVSQLRLLIKFFRENNASIFSSLAEVPIDLQGIVGSDFNENRIQKSDPNYIVRQRFLRELGIKSEVVLSSSDLETLRLVLEGYSSSQIAKQVYRSIRTIEHRLENIKSKLCCCSKQELIQKARELEHFGY